MSVDEDAVLLPDAEMLAQPPGVLRLSRLRKTHLMSALYTCTARLEMPDLRKPAPGDHSVILVVGTSSALLRQNRHDSPLKGV